MSNNISYEESKIPFSTTLTASRLSLYTITDEGEDKKQDNVFNGLFFDSSGLCTDKYKYSSEEIPKDYHLVSRYQLNKELDYIENAINEKANLTEIGIIKNNLDTKADSINKKIDDHIDKNKTSEEEFNKIFLDIFDKLDNIPTVLIRIAGTSKFNYCIKIGKLTIPIAKIELTSTI